MSRITPEEAFAEARSAMERGDWDGFFACLDRDTLLRIGEHAVPEEMVIELRAIRQRMAESAAAQVSQMGAGDPGAMLQQSFRHRQIVDRHQKVLRDTMKAVPDLPRFTAALERAMREVLGGGSVSSRPFVDEMLEDVWTEGTRAWAARRTPEGHSEDVGFVRRKGAWYVRVFAKRPGRSR